MLNVHLLLAYCRLNASIIHPLLTCTQIRVVCKNVDEQPAKLNHKPVIKTEKKFLGVLHIFIIDI
jgi:hypothetical protein